jgi:PAS domain S-box-containing protein
MQVNPETNKIIDGIQDGFFSLDRDWRFTYLNPAATQLVHYEAADLIGRVIWDEFPEFIGTDFESALRRAVECDVIQRVVTQGIYSGNWFNFIAIPKPEGLAVYCQDISEQMRLEEKLVFQTQLLESVHDAICASDENFITTYWNDMAEEMFGFSAEEVLGKPLPIQATIIGFSRNKAIANMINNGFYVGEAIYDHKNGTPVYTNVHAKVFKDSQGAYKGNIASFRDITRQKQVEKAVRESERKYRELLKYAPAGIYEIDFRKKRFLTVNDYLCQLSGYSREELLEMNPFDILDDQSKIAFQARINQWLKGEEPDKNVDYTVKAKDGRQLYVSLNLTFTTDRKGKPKGAMVVCLDVTERKKMEEALKYNEDMLRTILENSSDGINMLDLKTGRYVFMNQAQVELTGYSEEEINNISAEEAYDLVHPEDRELSVQQNELAAAGMSTYHPAEYRWKVKSGEYRWFSDRRKLVRDEDGQPCYLVGISRDITERKQAEKELMESQKQALELVEKLNRADSNKNEFISVLSHELRNPLTSIMMGITVLDQVSPGSEEAIQAREIIMRQTDHLTRLVDDLLDITRITQNKMQLKKERLELNGLVEQAVQDYRPQFAENKVGLEVRLNTGPVYLEADRARLTQAVGNLLANASRFTDTGGNTLVAVDTDQISREAVIRIKDTGLGIDPSLLSDLFEPFMQADSSPGRNHSGLGMGLSIVKGIAVLHGGSAAAFSEGLGKGAQFTIRLPLAHQEVQDSQAPEEPTLEEQPCFLRILVIDDMPTITNFMNILLKKLGHEVMIANNGPEGIAKAREFKPDVILCDIGMPGMDGYDVAREIRSDDRLKNIILIALSGYAQPEDLKNSKDVGFDRHLAKPVRMAVLRATLDEYCHEKLC